MTLPDEVRSLLKTAADQLDALCSPSSSEQYTVQDLRTLLAAQPEPQGVELSDAVVGFQDPDSGFLNKHEHRGHTEPVVLLTDAQHLLSTERAEAERKMAELQDRYECNTAIMHARTDALSKVTVERDQLSARVAELEARQVVMPEKAAIGGNIQTLGSDLWAAGFNCALDKVARLNPPQANSQEGEK